MRQKRTMRVIEKSFWTLWHFSNLCTYIQYSNCVCVFCGRRMLFGGRRRRRGVGGATVHVGGAVGPSVYSGGNADCGDCSGSVALLRLAVVFGVIFVIIGFILLMVGYFATPIFEEEIQNYDNSRIAGWVLFGIGAPLVLIGCLLGCRVVEDEETQATEGTAELGQVPVPTAPTELGAVAGYPPVPYPPATALYPPQHPIGTNPHPPYPGVPYPPNTNPYPLPGAPVADPAPAGFTPTVTVKVQPAAAADGDHPPSYADVTSGSTHFAPVLQPDNDPTV